MLRAPVQLGVAAPLATRGGGLCTATSTAPRLLALESQPPRPAGHVTLPRAAIGQAAPIAHRVEPAGGGASSRGLQVVAGVALAEHELQHHGGLPVHEGVVLL